MNPAELEAAEAVGGEPEWVSALREDVDRQIGKASFIVNINLIKGTVSGSSQAPSHIPARGGKNMEAFKSPIKNEKEEEKCKKAANGRTPAKSGKQKVAIPSSSSGSATSRSSEGAQPPEKTNATAKGKQSTQTGPVKGGSQTEPAAKAKG